MGSMVSGLADAVLGVAEGVGLSADTVARYHKCCGVVVKFCEQRDLDAHRQGRDVDACIAVLSTHLGHIGPAHTYWYYSDSRVIPISAPSRA